MSSIDGYSASTGWGIYCATKFAVEALSEALSKETVAIMHLVDAAEPPRRLPLGSDTVQAIANKHLSVTRELDRFRQLAPSTDFVR